MSDKDERFYNAKELIALGRVNTLEELYKQVPKKVIAETLNLNATRFSNYKSNLPGEFKFSEIVELSKALETDILVIVRIFVNSMK